MVIVNKKRYITMNGKDKLKVLLLWGLIILAVVLVLVIANGTSEFSYVIRDFLNIKRNIKIIGN